jgi:hypothetical protein
MIQFNLLPPVKIEYLKARRQQHVVVLISILASIIAVVIFVLSLSVVYGLQRKNLSDLNRDIQTNSSELQGTKDLSRILTIQNQLNTLPGLDSSSVISSRLYGYLNQVTPVNATIATLDVDFTQNTMVIAGNADNLATINTYVDELKFATYTVQGQSGQEDAFSSVVLAAVNRDTSGATYTIDLSFNPAIFSGTQSITLTVPNIVSTRSIVDQPPALFKPSSGS